MHSCIYQAKLTIAGAGCCMLLMPTKRLLCACRWVQLHAVLELLTCLMVSKGASGALKSAHACQAGLSSMIAGNRHIEAGLSTGHVEETTQACRQADGREHWQGADSRESRFDTLILKIKRHVMLQRLSLHETC